MLVQKTLEPKENTRSVYFLVKILAPPRYENHFLEDVCLRRAHNFI